MELRVEPATPKLFLERAAWRYPAPFDFYNDDGAPPKNPERFYGVFTEDGAVAGFYYFEERGDVIFYGLGLRPDLPSIHDALGGGLSGLQWIVTAYTLMFSSFPIARSESQGGRRGRALDQQKPPSWSSSEPRSRPTNGLAGITGIGDTIMVPLCAP